VGWCFKINYVLGWLEGYLCCLYFIDLLLSFVNSSSHFWLSIVSQKRKIIVSQKREEAIYPQHSLLGSSYSDPLYEDDFRKGKIEMEEVDASFENQPTYKIGYCSIT